MVDFPESPISPQEFLEGWVPKAFSESELRSAAEGLEVKLGVRLEGEGGGEWVFHLNQGSLAVEAGPRDETAFSVIQTVADWRGALWEGRGGIFGQQAVSLFRPGGQSAGGLAGAPLSPAVLTQLQTLNGLLRMVVTEEAGDWRSDFKLGPGEIPAEPTTTITVAAADAEAMGRGELDPMQAFMAGRIQVLGDMGLMMQVQAIQMQAAMGSSSS